MYGRGPKTRARTHDELELGLEDEDEQDLESHYQHSMPPPQQHHDRGGYQSHSAHQTHGHHHQQLPPQHAHHHHHLPDQPPPAKMARTGGPSMSVSPVMGMPGSSAGQQMPSPAPRPRGPKLKFTPEDDAKLVDLKEGKALTWKQIAEYFPGRSSGTLQVRYCTKLKAKTTQWTDETVRYILVPLRVMVAYPPRVLFFVLHNMGAGGFPRQAAHRMLFSSVHQMRQLRWGDLLCCKSYCLVPATRLMFIPIARFIDNPQIDGRLLVLQFSLDAPAPPTVVPVSGWLTIVSYV